MRSDGASELICERSNVDPSRVDGRGPLFIIHHRIECDNRPAWQKRVRCMIYGRRCSSRMSRFTDRFTMHYALIHFL